MSVPEPPTTTVPAEGPQEDGLSKEELARRLRRLDEEPAVWKAATDRELDPELHEVAGRLAQILARRGVASGEEARSFLAPSAEDLHDPLLLQGVQQAVERLQEARRAGERVAIVGDYDVDGVSASALLLAVFRALDIDARAILPHRLRDGYGFQPRQVDIASEWGAGVIVTVDCGTTSGGAIAQAQALGIDVIVTDHHLPGEELPRDLILVNPRQPGNEYPFPDLCGAGLALKLATALLEDAGRSVPVTQLARMACLGTIADVVPLRGENRVLAAVGLHALGDTRSEGLRALYEVSRVSPPLKASDIGYRIGPRINAAGRLDSPDQALELLLTRDAERAKALAEELDRLNTERREEEVRAVEEATEQFAALDTLPGILVAWSPRWHRGVVGIAAGRIARRFRRPAVLLAQGETSSTGSGRSVPGIHLFDFLVQFGDHMERFGGHAAAVGMTVANDQLEGLRTAAEERADWPDELMRRTYEYELELTASDYDLDFYRELRPLAPHGEGNREPLLRVGPLALSGGLREFGNDHLALAAAPPPGADVQGGRVQLVGWGWAPRREVFEAPFEVLATAEWDDYLGLPRLRIVDARPVG